METRCHNCDEPVSTEQAFCPNCGAVIGMADASARADAEDWDMQTTMVGQKRPSAPPPRPVTAPRAAYVPEPPAAQAAAAPARRAGNTVLLAVIGLLAVLLIGGLLYVFLNSQG